MVELDLTNQKATIYPKEDCLLTNAGIWFRKISCITSEEDLGVEEAIWGTGREFLWQMPIATK